MKFTLLLLSLPLLALAAPAPAPDRGHGNTPGYNQTEWLATLDETPGSGGGYNVLVDNDDPRTLDDLIAEMGLNRSDLRYVFDNSVFRGFSANLSEHCVGKLSTISGFKVFEPEMDIQLHDAVPGTWGLKRISQAGTVDVGTKDVKGYDFESYVFSGSARDLGRGVDIYMVDTGLNVGHIDFDGRATFGFAFDGQQTDTDGHGTHTAGTAGSTTFGVAKGANIISVKVLSGEQGSTGDIIKGIDWMIGRHDERKSSSNFTGSVASMSLGSKTRSATIEEVVKQASAAGIHFSVAAGNENQDACNASPAGASKGTSVVSVGSINVKDRRSSFSNFGSCVTVYGPGETIMSTWIGGNNIINAISGTSMACPHISGLMAVLLTQDPSLKLDTAKMKQKIVDLAQRITLDKDRNSTGDPGLVANNGNLRQPA